MVRSNKHKLVRVVWRLKEMVPFVPPDRYSNHQLHIAIMEEIGTDIRTRRSITEQMKKLRLITSAGLGTWKIADADTRSASGYGDKQQELGTMNDGTIDRVPPV